MPRAYECVRRAWHSDTHQPIRGYLIQEIFRIANEIHSSAIKNNKQWQEKLPVVVLKAEEIIYSKANSEAEYADFNTVWERANDAIDTIIRRDKASETDDLLHPCVEAALHLGCTPRKFSRSQRNNMPRFYLTPEKNEPVSNCSNMPEKLNPFLRRNTNSSIIIQENLKSPNVQPCYSSKPCSVFPLYFGRNQFLPMQEPSHFSSITKRDSSNVMTTETGFLETFETTCGGGCDLSLRLGPLCSSAEVSRMGRESSNSCNKVDLASSIKRDSKSQNLNEESTLRKRKVVDCCSSKNKLFCSR